MPEALQNPIPWLTAVLTILAFLQWRTMRAAWLTQRGVERAYVAARLVSFHVDSVEFHSVSGERFRYADAVLAITNFGNTPALVSGFEAHLQHGPAPSGPPVYQQINEDERAWLVRGEILHISRRYAVESEQWARALTGPNSYRLVGHVDYVDAFSCRHRGGFALTLGAPISVDAQTLRLRPTIGFETWPGWNYDRPRTTVGEGDDWWDSKVYRRWRSVSWRPKALWRRLRGGTL